MIYGLCSGGRYGEARPHTLQQTSIGIYGVVIFRGEEAREIFSCNGMIKVLLSDLCFLRILDLSDQDVLHLVSTSPGPRFTQVGYVSKSGNAKRYNR